MDKLTGLCPYTNLHETCRFSQPLDPDNPPPRFKECTHMADRYCHDGKRLAAQHNVNLDEPSEISVRSLKNSW